MRRFMYVEKYTNIITTDVIAMQGARASLTVIMIWDPFTNIDEL